MAWKGTTLMGFISAHVGWMLEKASNGRGEGGVLTLKLSCGGSAQQTDSEIFGLDYYYCSSLKATNLTPKATPRA